MEKKRCCDGNGADDDDDDNDDRNDDDGVRAMGAQEFMEVMNKRRFHGAGLPHPHCHP